MGLVGLLLLGGLTAAGLSWATKSASGCSSLPDSIEGPASPVLLVLELQGNTPDDAKSAQDFVTSQLSRVTSDLRSQFSVRLAFVKNGEKYALPGCLARPRYIVPPKEDLVTFTEKGTSADTKRQLEATMTRYRRDRIAWIAQEAGVQVRQVDFSDSRKDQPKFSPRFAINVAEAYDSNGASVALLSPFISTVKDCLAPTTNESVAQQVKDCVDYKQIGLLKAKKTYFVVESSLLDPATRDRADATRKALCQHVTTDQCQPLAAD